MNILKITGPSIETREKAVDKDCRIGRSPENDIVVPCQSISSRHAVVRVREEGVFIEDLGSTNGTIVDGAPIDREVMITPDSTVQIGDCTIVVKKEEFETDDRTREIDASKIQAESEGSIYSPFRFLRPFLEPVQRYLDDDSVSEIMINSPDEIFVEKSGKIERAPEKFNSVKSLVAAAKNIGRAIGRDVNEQRPIMDARLEDGSRVCVVLAPCALDGAAVAIRKFFKKKLTMDRLIGFGSMTEEMLEFLETSVLLKKNLIVSGGTGSGKTSLLNAVSSMIPNEERIIVIEDSAELQLQKEHLVRFEARPADDKGRYEVSIRDLLRATLRLRPDRIVIGEIRGGESFDLLQAMNTGHGGSMSTIHSNSPLDTLLRLENTALQSDVDVPPYSVKQQIANTIDIVVHTSRYRDGSRKVSHISEVLGLDSKENYKVQDIFVFKVKSTQDGKFGGSHVFTGKVPTFVEEIVNYGLPMPRVLRENA